MKKQTRENRLMQLFKRVEMKNNSSNLFNLSNYDEYINSTELEDRRSNLSAWKEYFENLTDLVKFLTRNKIQIFQTGKYSCNTISISKQSDGIAIELFNWRFQDNFKQFNSRLAVTSKKELSTREYWEKAKMTWCEMSSLEKIEILQEEIEMKIDMINKRIEWLEEPVE